MADPLFVRFKKQRERARQRGIPWRLEYWEWLQIWQDSDHVDERGRRSGEWVMGRNGDRGAYEASNVKIIRCETNNSVAQDAKKAKRRARLQLASR
jgi:hypothetical protein